MTRTPSGARNWRDRAARAAAADVGRASDPAAIAEARRLADRGTAGALVGLGVLAALGGVAGWTATAELLGPADAPVHAAAALLAIAGGPWGLLALRSVGLLLLRRRAGPVLGRLVTNGLLRAAERDATREDLAAATARRIGGMLAAGSGGRLASAGSGVFWTAYALAAVTAIWIVSARVALGFGWESSWIPPAVGRAVVEAASAPIEPFIGSEALAPVAPAPHAPADDPAALAQRQAWIRFLTAGVTVYLLLPMAAWTLLQAALGHRWAERWRPAVVAPSRPGTDAAGLPGAEVAVPPPGTPPADGSACTHVVRLERPEEAGALPAPLDRLNDLGDVDAAADLHRVQGVVHAGGSRVAVIGWLPATPDRGVRRRLRALAGASTQTPLLVLDGGDALRRTEPGRTAAQRLEDWRSLAGEAGVVLFECDLAALTDANRQRLGRAVEPEPAGERGLEAPQGRGSPLDPGAPAPGGGRPGLDPTLLDAAFAAIGRHLEGGDPLPSDAALASCLGEVAGTFRAAGGVDSGLAAWRTRLAALRDLDPADTARRAASLTRIGVGLLPAGLRARAVWTGVGGLLGAAACAAAATAAPAALLALPGWTAAGAGVAGLLSLVRKGGSPAVSPGSASSTTGPPQRLAETVFAASASAVLWWSQGADEARTTRALEALVPDGTVPAFDDPDGARRWLAAARRRVVSAVGREA